MNIVRSLPTDIRLLGEVILSKQFGVGSPEELTSQERHQAYEAIKKQIEPTARSIEDYQQKCKQAADYLQI